MELNNQPLDGKTVLVIGAAGLIGKVNVRGLLEQGAKVIAADLALEQLEKLYQRPRKYHENLVDLVEVDINSKSSLESLIHRSEKSGGDIDSVVNVAYPRGNGYGDHLLDVKLENFNHNLTLHLGGYFQVMQTFCKYFASKGRGKLVNFASVYGVLVPRFEIYKNTQMTTPVEYVAIKAGIIQLSKYFAKYFIRNNIQINCISPGGIFDGQPNDFVTAYSAFCGDLGMLQPETLNGALVMLLSDGSDAITGQNLIIDDGFSL